MALQWPTVAWQQHVGDALGHLLSISDGEHLGLLVVGGDLAGKNQRHHARLQARRASDTSGTSISSARFVCD